MPLRFPAPGGITDRFPDLRPKGYSKVCLSRVRPGNSQIPKKNRMVPTMPPASSILTCLEVATPLMPISVMIRAATPRTDNNMPGIFPFITSVFVDRNSSIIIPREEDGVCQLWKWGKSFNGELGQQEFVFYFIFFDGVFHLFHLDRVT